VNVRSANVLLIAVVASSCVAMTLSTGCGRASDPLRSLTQSADLIVLADVERVIDAPPAPAPARPAMPPGTDRIARLRVRETWKGRTVARVDVPFNDYAKWPAPPRYVEGETVVAFLRRAGGEWTTVGISAGTIVKHGEEIAALRWQVGDVIASMKDAEGRRLDWSLGEDQKSGGHDAAGGAPAPGVAPTHD
jgi:hypothetical protein